jgi:hypothetical protein
MRRVRAGKIFSYAGSISGKTFPLPLWSSCKGPAPEKQAGWHSSCVEATCLIVRGRKGTNGIWVVSDGFGRARQAGFAHPARFLFKRAQILQVPVSVSTGNGCSAAPGLIRGGKRPDEVAGSTLREVGCCSGFPRLRRAAFVMPGATSRPSFTFIVSPDYRLDAKDAEAKASVSFASKR